LPRPDPLNPAAGDAAPAFAEPWQASAFAMVVSLHESRLFTWTEWAATLAAVIRDPHHAGEHYYAQWLEALEQLIESRGITTHEALHDLAVAWNRAAETTPHGVPIRLGSDALDPP
jgi:nitrile hydratase accessory protein